MKHKSDMVNKSPHMNIKGFYRDDYGFWRKEDKILKRIGKINNIFNGFEKK